MNLIADILKFIGECLFHETSEAKPAGAILLGNNGL